MTNRQKLYLSIIQLHWTLNLSPPSLTQLSNSMGVSKGAAQGAVRRLKRDGYLYDSKYIIPMGMKVSFHDPR